MCELRRKDGLRGESMTREEAISNLNMISVAFVGPVTKEQRKLIDDTFGIAIQTLSQEPTTVIATGDGAYYKIKALQESCEDAISRQATIEAFQMFRGYEANRTNAEWVDRIETVVKKLPPVNPQPKAGHWTHDGSHWRYRFICSECGYKLFDEQTNYCPNCGVKMEREEYKE